MHIGTSYVVLSIERVKTCVRPLKLGSDHCLDPLRLPSKREWSCPKWQGNRKWPRMQSHGLQGCTAMLGICYRSTEFAKCLIFQRRGQMSHCFPVSTVIHCPVIFCNPWTSHSRSCDWLVTHGRQVHIRPINTATAICSLASLT